MDTLGPDELSNIFQILGTKDMIACSEVSKLFQSTMSSLITQLCKEKKFPSTTSVRDYIMFLGPNSAAFGDFFTDYTKLFTGDSQQDIMEQVMSGNWREIASLYSNMLTHVRLLYNEKGAEGVKRRIEDSDLRTNYERVMANADPIIMSLIGNYKQIFNDLLDELPCGSGADNWEIVGDLIFYLSKTEFTKVWANVPPMFQSFEKYRFHFLHTDESIKEALEVAEEKADLEALLEACCRCPNISEELFVSVVEKCEQLQRDQFSHALDACERKLPGRRVLSLIPTKVVVGNESFGWLIENERYDLLQYVAKYINRDSLNTNAERHILDYLVEMR